MELTQLRGRDGKVFSPNLEFLPRPGALVSIDGKLLRVTEDRPLVELVEHAMRRVFAYIMIVEPAEQAAGPGKGQRGKPVLG